MKLRKSSGMQQCDLKDLLYPVKIIDNPMPANSERGKFYPFYCNIFDLNSYMYI